MSERSNIRDVAARAGVAVKTVSRVLNGHPYVSADTKARVEEAMKALDFHPSVAARILSGAKSNQVALIYDNHSPYYMFQIQTGCWDFCRENGIRLLAQPVDVADPGVGEQVRGLVTETHVDGIILSSPVTDCEPVLRALESMDIPFVRISPGTNHALTSSVFMDDAQAADDMTTHLINAGHRRIGFIKGHPNHMASDDRLNGYRRALDRVGIAFD
ncbi:MAG: LacI family DNA-binding transcriptional regulator, partial [Novosphingobium sp.]